MSNLNVQIIRNEIRRILLTKWDPIGIGENLNLQDEYDSYLSNILHLANQQSDPQSMVEKELHRIERHLGMFCETAVRKTVTVEIVRCAQRR